MRSQITNRHVDLENAQNEKDVAAGTQGLSAPNKAITACAAAPFKQYEDLASSKKEAIMRSTIALIRKIVGIGSVYSWKPIIVRTLLATVLLGFATLATVQAQVPDCAPGKLSDYEKLNANGCLIGDKQFLNFEYHEGIGGLPGDAISVTPGTTPSTNDPAILFEGKWASAASDSYMSYMVATTYKGRPINGASLEMQLGQITGAGNASVIADLCAADGADVNCGAQKVELQVVLSADGKRKATDTAHFQQPQTEVRVTTPVNVVPGKGGDVELDGFMTVFQ
jgi:hypothetical protein